MMSEAGYYVTTFRKCRLHITSRATGGVGFASESDTVVPALWRAAEQPGCVVKSIAFN